MAGGTRDGVQIEATQRKGRALDAPVRNIRVFATSRGLHVRAEIGDERGYSLAIRLPLEELVAWLPELVESRSTMVAERSQHEVRDAVLMAEQRMRALAAQKAAELGVTLPHLEGDPVYQAPPAR